MGKNFFEVGLGNFCSDKLGAEPSLDPFFLAGLNGLGRPRKVLRFDFKENDAGRFIMESLDKIGQRGAGGVKLPSNANAGTRFGQEIGPAPLSEFRIGDED